MKTTIELPDALYREVKATAALKQKKMKDLVTRGLEMVLEDEKREKSISPLQALQHIQDQPPYTAQQVMEWQEESYRTRKAGFGKDD